MASSITQWVSKSDTTGEFKRQTSEFRDWISSEAGAKYPPEKGRYHLYISYACPWVRLPFLLLLYSSFVLPRY
jgi:glutathionyl-hydroquinone reductase